MNDDPLLDVQSVSKRYRFKNTSVAAVSSASFLVQRGERVAVTGASGSGKTTLLSIIGGLLTPDEGRVLVAGEDPYQLTPNRRAVWRASRIGFLFQHFHLLPFLSALENVCAHGLATHQDGIRADATVLLERFGLGDRLQHPPSRLSAGEQQRVALARAVIGKPSLILADEPTGNLDAESAERTFELLNEMAGEGLAVIVATHDDRMQSFADRQLRMEKGAFVSS